MTDQVRLPLCILAFDHRNSLRRTFFGIEGSPTAVDDEQARRAKWVIFQGLCAGVAGGIDGTPGVLVDAEYGAEVIAAANENGIVTAAPVERSGRAVLEFEHGDHGFGPAIERVDPTYAKVLVRHNPDGDDAANELQRQRLTSLQRWISDHGRSWMLELLVPPTERQLETAGSAERFDLADRPTVTVRAIDDLTSSGLRPDLWKLEGMPSSAAYRAVADATGSATTCHGGCLVLGRGADEDAVDRWLRLAAPVAGFVGFAVGRTLWWGPLRDMFDGKISNAQAAVRIGANYTRLVNVYLAAARRHPADRPGS